MSSTQLQGPPPYQAIGRHAVMSQVDHDEAARFNFLTHMNRFLSTRLLPRVKDAYERSALPRFQAAHGRAPADRREVRQLMADETAYQQWSALRRGTMELRQQTGRAVVLRQLDRLNQVAAELNVQPGLKLDPSLPLPRYIAAVDQHCMPGSYHTELVANDVSPAANYDAGIFATTGGGLGRYSDGGGWAVVEWLREQRSEWLARHASQLRILDLGCGLGHNTLPLAQAFPHAQVTAIDVAAPMLRYGHARARSLGVSNVAFIQADAEQPPFAEQSFDLVLTCMFLHETSRSAINRVFQQSYRLLADDGISLHLEQPQYAGMPVYEQFIRDWDAHNNNEPFWTTMHDLDLRALAADAGFAPEQMFETGLAAVVDESLFPKPDKNTEDYGRAAAWYVFGAAR